LIKQPKRILVVNPNTTNAVTQAYVDAITAISPPDVTFKGVTGTFGAKIVTVEAENTVAAYGTLALIAEHVVGFDAVILAISFDSGLTAAQSILPLPVVGISSAALHAAAQGQRSVGVIFFGEKSRALYESLIQTYGVTPVGCIAIDIGSVDDYLTPQSKDAAVKQAAASLVEAGAESIAIFGSAIVSMAARLQPYSAVPLYDGLEALGETLRQIEDAPKLKADPQLPVGPSENLTEELIQLLAGTLIKRI
jgi:allantoin racemase